MANQGTVKHYAKLLAELGFAAYGYDFCGGCVMMGKSDGKRRLARYSPRGHRVRRD